MPSLFPPLEPIAAATPTEQLRQQLTLAKIAAASLGLPRTERERRALRMLLKSIDDASRLLYQVG